MRSGGRALRKSLARGTAASPGLAGQRRRGAAPCGRNAFELRHLIRLRLLGEGSYNLRQQGREVGGLALAGLLEQMLGRGEVVGAGGEGAVERVAGLAPVLEAADQLVVANSERVSLPAGRAARLGGAERLGMGGVEGRQQPHDAFEECGARQRVGELQRTLAGVAQETRGAGIVVAFQDLAGANLGVDAEDRRLGHGGVFDLLDQDRCAPLEARGASLRRLERERRGEEQERAGEHEPIVRRSERRSGASAAGSTHTMAGQDARGLYYRTSPLQFSSTCLTFWQNWSPRAPSMRRWSKVRAR